MASAKARASGSVIDVAFTVCGVLGSAARGKVMGCMISNNMARSPRELWCSVCLLGALFGMGLPAGASPAAEPLDTVLPEAVEPGSSAPLGSDALLFASPTTRDHIGRVVVPVMINGRGP